MSCKYKVAQRLNHVAMAGQILDENYVTFTFWYNLHFGIIRSFIFLTCRISIYDTILIVMNSSKNHCALKAMNTIK